MQVSAKGSFHRDWKKIRNRQLSREVILAIAEIEAAETLNHIIKFKKLRKYSRTYKKEIVAGRKTYWMLCFIHAGVVYIVRLKPEIYFKNYM